MKRELETSIRDNWYCDLYPTYIDYMSTRWINFLYRTFGYTFHGILLEIFRFRKLRVLEIYFYRRQQLKYYDK